VRFMRLWVAHYNQSVTRPDMPKGGTSWDFWKYTEDYPADGWGVESREIDMNYYNGTEQEFNLWYGSGNPPTVPDVSSTLTVQMSGRRAVYEAKG